jgi:hypothetical protein
MAAAMPLTLEMGSESAPPEGEAGTLGLHDFGGGDHAGGPSTDQDAPMGAFRHGPLNR